MRIEHVLRRTVTEADNLIFSALTHNPAALHLDEEYMKGTEFGTRIVNSGFTLALMVGISVGDTTLGTTIANLGWDEVRFPAPGVPGRYSARRDDRTRNARESFPTGCRHRGIHPSLLQSAQRGSRRVQAQRALMKRKAAG